MSPYLAAGVGLVATGVTFIVKKVVDTDRTLAAHIVEDRAVFKNIEGHFTDLKNGQQNQTDKLDRLIERL